MEEDRKTEVQEEITSNQVRNPVENTITPGPSGKNGSGKKWIVIFVTLIVIGVGGYFAYSRFSTPQDRQEDLTTTPKTSIQESTSTPTQTEAPKEVDKSKIKIKILNGTGISGEAGLLKTKLTEVGYSQIETGNSDKQDYTTTEVTFSSKVPKEVTDEITNKLKEIYSKVNTTSKDLKVNDIEIITGLRKGITPKPTASPTPKVTSSPTPTATISATPSISPTKTPTPT